MYNKKSITFTLLLLVGTFATLQAEWQDIKILNNSSIITSSFILPDNSVVVFSDFTTILKSNNTQDKWKTIFLHEQNFSNNGIFNIKDSNSIIFTNLNTGVSFSEMQSNIYILDCNSEKILFTKNEKVDSSLTAKRYNYATTINNSNKIVACGSRSSSGSNIPMLSISNDGASEWQNYFIEDYINEGANSAYFFNDSTYILRLFSFNDNGKQLKIIKTTNSGKTWKECFYKKDFNPIIMKFYNDSIGIITGNGNLIKTSDGGNTWINIYSENSFEDNTYSFADIYFFNADTILIVGKHVSKNKGVICCSKNGGSSWEILHRIDVLSLLSIAVRDKDIYCFGRNGIMVKGTIDDLDNITEPLSLVSSTVYPNPTAAENIATVRLELEDACDLRIVLSDVLGQEIMQIHEGFADAGTFTKSFTTQHLQKGVYFLKTLIGGQYKIEKIVVND